MAYPVDILTESTSSRLENDGSNSNKQDRQRSFSCSCTVCHLETTVSLTDQRLKETPLFGELSDRAKESHWVKSFCCQSCHSGLAVHGNFWSNEECLRSSKMTLDGLVQVESYAHRFVLYVLSQVIFQQEEQKTEDSDVTFLAPGPTESGKIYWRNGEAAAFYTLKPKGLPYSSCSYLTYQMPVVDLIYVRKKFRRQGLASAMLLDVMNKFPDEDIGFSEPVSDNMLKVVAKLLQLHPDRREQLWETSWTGNEGFRNNLWLLICRLRRDKLLK